LGKKKKRKREHADPRRHSGPCNTRGENGGKREKAVTTHQCGKCQLIGAEKGKRKERGAPLSLRAKEFHKSVLEKRGEQKKGKDQSLRPCRVGFSSSECARERKKKKEGKGGIVRPPENFREFELHGRRKKPVGRLAYKAAEKKKGATFWGRSAMVSLRTRGEKRKGGKKRS